MIPNYCHALNLSAEKIQQLLADVVYEQKIKIELHKAVLILQTLTNEPSDLVSLELSAKHLQELGLSRSTAFRYVKAIKALNNKLSSYKALQSEWCQSRLFG